jgi:hypothetical protein
MLSSVKRAETFGDALRAVGHHHVLHHDQDEEHDQADHVVAGHDVAADRRDDVAA